MILAGVVGPAFFAANFVAKWTLFILGCIWFLPILYALAVDWAGRAKATVKSTYSTIAFGTVLLWTAYPVMWVLGEGLGIVDDTKEVLLYAILDILAKAALGFILLGNHTVIEDATSGHQQLG